MIRNYVATDYEEIRRWYHDRNMDPIRETFLPKVGYIVPSVAAGFLIQTDAKLGFLENYISNPNTDKKIRRRALFDVTNALIQKARDLGFERLFAITDNNSIPFYCNEYAFKYLGSMGLYCKEIL